PALRQHFAQRVEALGPVLLQAGRRLAIRQLAVLHGHRTLRRPLRQEPDGDNAAVRTVQPHRLLRRRRPYATDPAVEPPAAHSRIGPRPEQRLDRHVVGARLVRFEGAVALLAARAQALDALVADSHRLRPPAVDLVLLADQRRDVAVRHLVGTVVIERGDPSLPRAPGLRLERGIAGTGELG